MTLSADKCWRGRGEVKGGRLRTKPGMKRRSDGFICLTDSPLSLWTCVYVCVPSADSWLDMTVLLPCFSSPLRRWTSLYSHCPSSFLLAFLTFLKVSVHLCECVFICAATYMQRERPELWCWQQWWWWRRVTGKRVIPEERGEDGEEEEETELRGSSLLV